MGVAVAEVGEVEEVMEERLEVEPGAAGAVI